MDLLDFKRHPGKQVRITESVAASLQDLDFSKMRLLSGDNSRLIALKVDIARASVSQK
jgi:hypothetical protein